MNTTTKPTVAAVMADIEREVHERWCGSPPSCGLTRGCEGNMNHDEMRIVRKHVRAALSAKVEVTR